MYVVTVCPLAVVINASRDRKKQCHVMLLKCIVLGKQSEIFEDNFMFGMCCLFVQYLKNIKFRLSVLGQKSNCHFKNAIARQQYLLY